MVHSKFTCPFLYLKLPSNKNSAISNTRRCSVYTMKFKSGHRFPIAASNNRATLLSKQFWVYDYTTISSKILLEPIGVFEFSNGIPTIEWTAFFFHNKLSEFITLKTGLFQMVNIKKFTFRRFSNDSEFSICCIFVVACFVTSFVVRFRF